MKNGFIILNKEGGMTSQTAVNRVKRLLHADKAGHAGTLDPMATGVLHVLINRGVKASEYMLSADKHYRATLLLGLTTDTEDITGTVLTRSDALPDGQTVHRAIQELTGTHRQTPPMYSALKVGGRKLCDLARAGVTVERQERSITVFSIQDTRIDDRSWQLDIHCSKGTYIRTLCADIGKKLGTGGVMAALTRTEACGYTLEQACTLSELEAMSDAEREACIHPVEELFLSLPAVELSPFFARLARGGQPLSVRKLRAAVAQVPDTDGTRVRLMEAGRFFALGELGEATLPGMDAPEPVIRAIRQFELV